MAAFLGAELRRGIEIITRVLTDFGDAAAKADLIITGEEGRLDGQERTGKVDSGPVPAHCEGKKVVALCGKLSATPQQIETIGLAAAHCINREERPWQKC